MGFNLNEALARQGLNLPKVAPPAGAYAGNVIHGNLLYIAGQLPMQDGKIIYAGKLGTPDLSIEEGQQAARLVALNIIAQIDDALAGDWSRFERIIRLNGFVNAAPDFKDHPKIINGASELMAAIFEAQGIHTRIALGASSLPFGAAVEIDAIIGLSSFA
ncbi:MAG: RidA family protein [Alphaproteobacteria bacterium]